MNLLLNILFGVFYYVTAGFVLFIITVVLDTVLQHRQGYRERRRKRIKKEPSEWVAWTVVIVAWPILTVMIVYVWAKHGISFTEFLDRKTQGGPPS